MASDLGAGECAYCGEPADILTEDHVFARSLSGNPEAKAAEKWIVPACDACNNRYSTAEREIVISFGLTVETDDDLMGDVAARAIRSVTPAAARTEKDQRHRAMTRDAMRARRLSWDVLANHPNSVLLGDVERADRERQFPVRIPGKAVRTFAEKLVRGVTYHVTGRPVPKTYEVKVEPWHGQMPYEEHLAEGGHELRIGRSAVVRCAFSPKDANVGVFQITLWERLRFAGCVVPSPSLRAPQP